MQEVTKSQKIEIPLVLLVIVNYNGRHLLKKHLPSVVKTIYPDLKIVVVDNGSEDDSVEFLRENYPQVEVVENGRNLGFGRANNVAFRKFPDYDYYALLNNDMDVEPDWLEKLVECAEGGGGVVKDSGNEVGLTGRDTKIGAVGPKILYSEKRDGNWIINSAGMVVDKHYRGFDRYEGEVDDQKYSIVEEVDSLCGGAILLRGSAVHQIKGFDRRMFLYYEDVDLCLRLKDTGWKIMYNGGSVVYHDHMGTIGKILGQSQRTYHSNMNRVKSIMRRIGWLQGVIEMVGSLLEWLWCKVTGRDYIEFITAGNKT